MDRTTPFQPWAANDGVKKDRELLDDAKHHRENVNHPKHTQTASYDKESAVAPSNVPGPSSVSGSGSDPPTGMEAKMDSAKIASMQQFVENSLSPEARQRVSQLLEAVEALSGTERLLLYLRLPTGVPPHDPLKQPVNPLGSRAELQQTVTWIQTHLEVDPDVSLPKQDVYEEYITHCMSSVMKPLSTADFGKVMKQVYPTVRPRRLGTRGNSRYCYAGLRKKIKLEVPQLPDLGESSKETTVACRETERVVCDWAESKLGLKFNGLSELSRHLLSAAATAPRPVAGSPPPLATLSQPHAPCEDPASRQLMKQLKRKIQTHGTPGRPKKYKGQELGDEVAPSTSYGAPLHPGVKHEGEPEPPYDYPETYGMYDVRAGYYPRRPHPQLDYRSDPYQFDPSYAPRDLTLPPADALHNLPINLSSDASLDLSTERAAWQRRRPPEPPPPPPPRLPLPGKKLILETYQSSQEGSPRAPPPPPPPADSFPREYLPKKMRAAEIMGGKLAAARQQLHADAPSTSAGAEASVRSEVAFLEDPKNVSSRSTSTAAALAREEQEAASPTRPAEAPTCRASRARPAPAHSEQDCCTLAGISLRSGVICQEKHSEILTRERVISICNIDKHDLDDYLNETSSQENEEELLHYFHRDPDAKQANTTDAPNFLETRLDPQDDHSQGKNEKICQLRELLAKNLKNQSGSSFLQKSAAGAEQPAEQAAAFKPVAAPATTDVANGPSIPNPEVNRINSVQTNGTTMPTLNENGTGIVMTTAGTQLYNGNGHHNVPQSPTTRTQAYDFVPINDGCHSPRTFNSKSPLGFGHRGLSPTKVSKCAALGGSLQTSPVPHSSAASPFVSPRNTPVPRSRACSRPIPKHNGRKRRNPLTLGVGDPCQPFAIPNEQKFIAKSACVPGVKYCQPMSAPPSPNIVSCHYKNQLFQCATGITNGNHHVPINFLPTPLFRETAGPELLQPHSADPLSSEVSQFFHESLANYRAEPDAFRSQSVPLKPGMHNIGMQYNKTPIGSVPPTPVPNEFCDFGSLADTCDISKAGLNPETLDKIYDAIDSSNDVLNAGDAQTLLSTDDSMVNGCDMLPEQQILTDEINSLIPGGELLDRGDQFSQSYEESPAADNVEDFLKRTNSIEFDLSDLVSDKNKYYMSRSVPSTPLPSLKRAAPTLQLDPRRARELFAPDSYSASNGLSSKSVPSTPQLVEEKSVFNYGNRDFLINGNSVETCSNPIHVVDSQELTSPLHEILREDILEPLTPATDLMSDLDKMEPPYVDI